MHLKDDLGEPTTSGALINVEYIAKVKTKKLAPKQQEHYDILNQIYMSKLGNLDSTEDVFVTQKEWRDACDEDISNTKKKLIDYGYIEEPEDYKFKPLKD